MELIEYQGKRYDAMRSLARDIWWFGEYIANDAFIAQHAIDTCHIQRIDIPH